MKQLLPPLSREQIGLVRCLGLNYADHAVRGTFLSVLKRGFNQELFRLNLTWQSLSMSCSYIHFIFILISTCRYPVLFYKPVTAIIGPDAPITIPKVTQPVDKHLPDYEVELTIVIGKPCKDASEADALDYVLGYTAANDVRARLTYVCHFFR